MVPLVIGDHAVPKATKVKAQLLKETGNNALGTCWKNLYDNRKYGLIKVGGMDLNEACEYDLALLRLPVAEA